MSNLLYRLLEERPWLLADGATGTNYFAAGLVAGDPPELWNVEQPERVERLHRGFIDAGADIVLTNSFGGTRQRMKLHRSEHRVGELNLAAARVARKLADAAGRPVVVAGSIGPTGELMQPLGELTAEIAVASFKEQAEALADGGVDCIWIETMSSVEEVTAACSAAAETGLPIVCTMSFDTKGCTMMGIKPSQFAALVGEMKARPVAYGANCGVGAAELVATLVHMRAGARAGDVLVAKSNCGIPEMIGTEIQYSGTPELMADYARLARDAGARIIGGCCGTTAAHLTAMRQALETHEPGAVPGLDEISARLGDLSAGARRLQAGGAPAGRRSTGGRSSTGRRRGRDDSHPHHES